MSRSYRKPYIRDSGTKYWKNQANKKVRKAPVVGNFGLYKKVFDSWNIYDYRCYWDEPKWRRK